MRMTPLLRTTLLTAAASTICFLPLTGYGQANAYRGLWIGSVSLSGVNEVPISLDEINTPIGPDPEVPTPTFDAADLRLIIHVNGAGQASLLKDVAILNRVAGQVTSNGTAVIADEDDLSLVTDPMLYAMFPAQHAVRYGSAVFDFGDAKATDALDVIVEEAAQQAMMFVTNSSLDVSTQGARVTARDNAVALIEPLLDDIVDHADVADAFDQFLLLFDTAAISAIITNTSDPIVATLQSNALVVLNQSFYGDTRAQAMVSGVVAAVNAALPGDEFTAAHHTASAFADVDNLHQKFVSGSIMGDMIDAAAVEAGAAAKLGGATVGSIDTAIRGIAESVDALAVAASAAAKVPMYTDNRSTDAVNAVLAAMASNAFLNAALPANEIEELSEQAGRAVLSDMVARYPLPVIAPTSDYTDFVRSNVFAEVSANAAFAAADAAIEERAVNLLYTAASVYSKARIAAIQALQPAFSAAARVMRTELPLTGTFSLGSGDPRLIASLAQPSDLGQPGGLEGRIYLPANYPSNPFRHRRHSDHSTGYNIERFIRFDFDGSVTNSIETAHYGVDKITGTYREEIFGLHKPLGPNPTTDPVGLLTEGRFELNRISLIDTLNAH